MGTFSKLFKVILKKLPTRTAERERVGLVLCPWQRSAVTHRWPLSHDPAPPGGLSEQGRKCASLLREAPPGPGVAQATDSHGLGGRNKSSSGLPVTC